MQRFECMFHGWYSVSHICKTTKRVAKFHGYKNQPSCHNDHNVLRGFFTEDLSLTKPSGGSLPFVKIQPLDCKSEDWSSDQTNQYPLLLIMKTRQKNNKFSMSIDASFLPSTVFNLRVATWISIYKKSY